MSYYIYSNLWRPMDISNVDGYVLPFGKDECGKTRAYRFSNTTYIYGAAESYRVYWALVANNGKEHTCFEIYYKFPYYDNDWRWHHLPYSVTEKLFKVKGNKWKFGEKIDKKWQDACEVVKVSDRAILRFTTSFMKSALWGVNKETIRYTLAAKLVKEFSDILGVTMFHPDSIKNMIDATVVYEAIKTLRDVGWKIWNNKFEDEKNGLLTRIKQEQALLDGFNDEFQNCLDQAAESMNRLSSGFGIEVQL